MKEIKFILHAFLLLLAFISVLICLKAVYSTKEPGSKMVLIDRAITEASIYSKGKLLFQSKCGACHVLGRNFTGPSLCGLESRGPWGERQSVYQWIKNPMEFMRKDQYTKQLKEDFGGVMMSAFPDLSKDDIDEIINYINSSCELPPPNIVVVN
jgi:cytochrome c2